jgi:hypothetical protein
MERKPFLQRTMIVGLIGAVFLALTPIFQAMQSGIPMPLTSLIPALLIGAFGYLGKYFTGEGNTSVALIFSTLVSIIPMIFDGSPDWKAVIGSILLSITGLLSKGMAQRK